MQDAQPFRGDSDKHSHDSFCTRRQNYNQIASNPFEINLQMESKIDPETIKIQAPGAVLEPSGDPLGGLGVSGGAS